jgi:hypothetical protein
MKKSILEAARVIRSKNSGPFELTLDILFSSRRHYELFRARDIVNRELICRLYAVEPADVLGIVYFDPCSALKVTLRRRIPSGAPGDTDIYGAQQHAPLLSIEFDDQEEK